MNRRALRGVPWLLALALVALALPPAAHAQPPRVWTPPTADSAVVWAAQARARFETNRGDSVGGANYRAYELTGLAARRLLRALGRPYLPQAISVEAVLDSLGMDTEVALDPDSPGFALVMVHNPVRRAAGSVGYLYWYRGNDLRMQGVLFRGGGRPRMRVWWTGHPEFPYECGVIEQALDGLLGFTLLRLSPSGSEWTLQQDDSQFPVLGEVGTAEFVDLNRDQRPEVVSWTVTRTDSLFHECSDCPRLLVERIHVEGPAGFELHDSRVLPSPYATFVQFVRLIGDRNLAQAARLLADSSRVRAAQVAGFGVKKGPGTWTVEYAEPNAPWPTWIAVRFDGPHGVKRYIVHFAQRGGRWVIRDWIEPRPAVRPLRGITIPPAPGKK